MRRRQLRPSRVSCLACRCGLGTACGAKEARARPGHGRRRTRGEWTTTTRPLFPRSARKWVSPEAARQRSGGRSVRRD
eukprot:scaffold36392_cov30-Tisochrysis_lutea.AAC.4